MTGARAASDEELIGRLRSGGDNNGPVLDELMNRYRELVKIKARAYFITGADREDVIQEGMIGLFKAIRDYDQTRGITFGSFARVCMERQMITAIRSANRGKHAPLNNSVPIDALEDFEARQDGPEERVIRSENVRGIKDFIDRTLSETESRILSLYLMGNAYAKIAEITGKNEKAVDNALQRVRRKLALNLRM